MQSKGEEDEWWWEEVGTGGVGDAAGTCRISAPCVAEPPETISSTVASEERSSPSSSRTCQIRQVALTRVSAGSSKHGERRRQQWHAVLVLGAWSL